MKQEDFSQLLNPASWSFQEMIGQAREWTPRVSPRTVTASANVNPLDGVILVSGNTTLTLEASAGADGRQHIIIKTDSSSTTVTIDGNAAETINGTATITLTGQYSIVVLYSDGTNWLVSRPPNQYNEASWTLAITGWTLGNATVVSTYTRVGNLVTCEFSVTVGTTTVVGAGTVTITGLPFSAASTLGMKGIARLVDDSASNTYIAGIEVSAVTSIRMWNTLATIGTLPAGLVTNTQPFTFATSDIIAGSFTYRV